MVLRSFITRKRSTKGVDVKRLRLRLRLRVDLILYNLGLMSRVVKMITVI